MNAMLATKIFINEVSLMCDEFGIDVENVRRGIGSDSRIGSSPSFIPVVVMVALVYQKM